MTIFDSELLELIKEMRIEVSDIKSTTNRIDGKVEDNLRYIRDELSKLQTIENCNNKQQCCQIKEIHNYKIKKIAIITSSIGVVASIIIAIINRYL